MNVVDGEEGGDAQLLGGGRNESRHPVVAVDDVRADLWDDVVNEVPLESEGGEEEIVTGGGIYPAAAIEAAILCKVDPAADGNTATWTVGVIGVVTKEIPVVWDCEVDVLPSDPEAVHEKRGDISQTSGFGPESFSIFGEFFGNVGDFRGDEEDAWRLLFGHGVRDRRRLPTGP